MTRIMAPGRWRQHETVVTTGARTANTSLLPREKGAWGQVLFPIATGLAIAHGHPAALGFAVAAVAAFFAHEPVLVLLGGRGDRTRRAVSRRALAWVGVCGGAGTLALAGGVALAPATARIWLAAPIALSLASLAVLAAGRERTTAGELLAAAAVSSWMVPMATAASFPPAQGIRAWIAYVAAFTGATIAVRGVLEAFKNHGQSRLRGAASLLSPALLIAATGAWLAGGWSVWFPIAIAPTLVLSLAVSVRPIHPRHLRTVGWTLIAATAVLAIVVTAAST